jgi:hypothetical protein
MRGIVTQAIALIKHALQGMRTLGVECALRAAVYRFRRSYYEGKFATGDDKGSMLSGLGRLFTAEKDKPLPSAVKTRCSR